MSYAGLKTKAILFAKSNLFLIIFSFNYQYNFYQCMQPQPQQPQNQTNQYKAQKMQQTLHKKFKNFVSKQSEQNLNKGLRNFHGKNYVIDYKPEYNFTEQWQGKGNSEKQNEINLLEENGMKYFIFSLGLMLVNIATIWTLSVERYFSTNQIRQETLIFHILLVFILSDIGLNVYFHHTLIQSYQFDIFKQLKFNKKYLLVLTFYIYSSITSTNDDNTIDYFIQATVMILLYVKAQQIYKCIKVTEFSLKYESQIKIMDLLFNVLIQAHIFAVILFSSSKINTDKNWVLSIGIQDEPPLTKYIYSLYFASTTMLTIGYGDITPKNPHQIMITICIQIVGVVSFGYLLNEMGHTLSKMRQQREQLQRDLQTISKISKYYSLERKLQNKAKNFLFSNQVNTKELKVEDENRVLMKLNEQLRQQINHQNSLTVVKSCIFFLCHWSKNMQSQIAKHLEKRLFAPNQKLISANGLPRIYIIKHGRIDVFMDRYGSNQQYRKLLRIINTALHGQVSNNIYGYTTVFSNRPVRLDAIAKEFTSTYSINRNQFLQCVRQNPHDFQYYHEVKCRIDQSSFCEEWEAPAINNIREHYSPSRIVVIKKFRKVLESSCNTRRDCKRRNKSRYSRLLQDFTNKVQISSNAMIQKTIVFTTRKLQKDSQQIEQVDSYQSSQISSEQDFVKLSYEQAVATLKTRSVTNARDEGQNKLKIAHNFQAYKEFFNFFRKNNISIVLRSFQKQNHVEGNVNKSLKIIQTFKKYVN